MTAGTDLIRPGTDLIEPGNDLVTAGTHLVLSGTRPMRSGIPVVAPRVDLGLPGAPKGVTFVRCRSQGQPVLLLRGSSLTYRIAFGRLHQPRSPVGGGFTPARSGNR